MPLTPDLEVNASLKVPIGKGGDVADVAALIIILGDGDQQSGVGDGAAALKLHPAGVTPKFWQNKNSFRPITCSFLKPKQTL